MLEQNPDLDSKFTAQEKAQLRIVNISKWRDGRRASWIVEMARCLIKQGEVVMDLVCLEI